MSRRTLQRRLAAQGHGFQDLVDTARRDLAEQLLRRTEFALAEVAFLTGYAGQSTFTRAFKRWHGMPIPARYVPPDYGLPQYAGEPRMKNTMTVTYLAVGGLLLLAIGSAILLAPHAFHGSNGIARGEDPNLLSEIRAPGGLLAVSSLVILSGALRTQLRSRTVQLCVLVYGSFSVARLASMALDGTPATSIVGATVLELIVALVGLALWQDDS